MINSKKNWPCSNILYYLFFAGLLITIYTSCSPKVNKQVFTKNEFKENFSKISVIDDVKPANVYIPKQIITGAEQTDNYLHLLKDKRVALIVNQTSLIEETHIVDFLLSKNVNLLKIFAPEHGFRGNVDRGKHFKTDFDEKTGLPIIAMYGNNRKPRAEQLKDIDIVIFDIQDVGVRFYTYISSMHYVMEACAENNKKVIILDRPNPLGDYVDGPVLQKKYKSFVGMHAIPVVHGLTVGELAIMINEEGWLKNSVKCDLEVIKIQNYNHTKAWSLKVKPSPNLPNDLSIRLYPSLCFFEATNVSIGRGTSIPFQVIGYPDKIFGNFTFVPKDIAGMQINPVQENKICYGIDLRDKNTDTYFTLKYIIDFAEKFKNKNDFISKKSWFNLLAGNGELANQIISGMTEDQIRKTWQKDLENYKILRKKYLLYVDFE